jgi:hypothetical protein
MSDTDTSQTLVQRATTAGGRAALLLRRLLIAFNNTVKILLQCTQLSMMDAMKLLRSEMRMKYNVCRAELAQCRQDSSSSSTSRQGSRTRSR